MNLFKKLFRRKAVPQEYEASDIDWEELANSRPEQVERNIHSPEERKQFVTDCLEQINEAAARIEQLNQEYHLVTSYLKDIEEIERLPEEESTELRENALKVIGLGRDTKKFIRNKNRLTEVQNRKIERLEDDMPEAYEKIRQGEEYHAKIKQDLIKLDGERHAYEYRQTELECGLANTRGMIVISLCAFGVCTAMLLALRLLFEMDIQAGFLLSTAAAAITLTAVFVKHSDYRKELVQAANGMNRLICLQNRVKIRYVNSRRLLEYYYVQYEVDNGNELKILWEKYQEERDQRKKLEQTREELNFYQTQMVKLLKRCRISDPDIWLHQAQALLDSREMVEIRHGLNTRRQNLRSQIAYNQDIAADGKQEVKRLAQEYPEYADEILQMVSEYDARVSG